MIAPCRLQPGMMLCFVPLAVAIFVRHTSGGLAHHMIAQLALHKQHLHKSNLW
jgi:hypothetical protein